MSGTASNRRHKPSKPYPSFPLTAHNNGQWCKKIRGKVHFFGTWDDPESALQRYLQVAMDLHSGRQPSKSTVSSGSILVKDVCNHYLTRQRRRSESGEITAQWYEDCCRTMVDFASFIGAHKAVKEVGPLDFSRYRQKLRRQGLSNGRSTFGFYALDRSITVVKAAFTHAYEVEIIDRPVRFGRDFRRSSATDKRRAQAATIHQNGRRCFSAEDVRDLLNTARYPLKAMILLGINGGFGNKDCAKLPRKAIDFRQSIIDFPRPKSGVPRIVPLWPQTTEALRRSLAQRPQASSSQADELVFLTAFGRPWIHQVDSDKESRTDAIGQEFDKLLRKLGLKRKGLGFYALRHTFRTWADEVNDQHAIHRIMGHVVPGMSGIYVQEIGLDRLRRVVNHVRAKLLGEVPDSQDDLELPV